MDNKFWELAFKNSFKFYEITDNNGNLVDSNLTYSDLLIENNLAIIDGEFYFYKELSLNNIIIKTYEVIPRKILYQFIADEKTGAYSNNVFKLLLSNYAKNGNDMVLCMFDLDNFKGVNDTYGHDIGDELLAVVTRLVKHNLKQHDLICRFGGDEFIILFNNCDLSKASVRMNEIMERLRRGVVLSNGVLFNISISVGLTSYNLNSDYDTNLKNADSALYTSKKTGKNKLTLN